MIVARVGETERCAQFIVSWMRQLLAPSATAATSHTQENAGIASPASGMHASESAPATRSCTTVTRPTSTRPANSPMRRISAAIGSVLTSVASSPAPSATPSWGPATKSSPTKASAPPARASALGRFRNAAHCSSGTSGTYSAVMKADVLLGIVCSPYGWRR